MDERARERGARDGRAAAAGSECVILSANFTYTLTNPSQIIRLELGIFFIFIFHRSCFPPPLACGPVPRSSVTT